MPETLPPVTTGSSLALHDAIERYRRLAIQSMVGFGFPEDVTARLTAELNNGIASTLVAIAANPALVETVPAPPIAIPPTLTPPRNIDFFLPDGTIAGAGAAPVPDPNPRIVLANVANRIPLGPDVQRLSFYMGGIYKKWEPFTPNNRLWGDYPIGRADYRQWG